MERVLFAVYVDTVLLIFVPVGSIHQLTFVLALTSRVPPAAGIVNELEVANEAEPTLAPLYWKVSGTVRLSVTVSESSVPESETVEKVAVVETTEPAVEAVPAEEGVTATVTEGATARLAGKPPVMAVVASAAMVLEPTLKVEATLVLLTVYFQG